MIDASGKTGTPGRIDACGVVLAGGKSRRMGFDKAGIRLGGETLLARAVRKMAGLFPEILVVGRAEDAEGSDAMRADGEDAEAVQAEHTGTPIGRWPCVRIIQDILPGCGPLGGIHAALRNARLDRIFVTACDMPFWDEPVARLLVAASRGELGPASSGSSVPSPDPGFDAAVPLIGRFTEPLLACYSRSCLPIVESRLQQGQLQVQGLYGCLSLRFVSEAELRAVCDPERVAFNINSAADLSTCLVELARMSQQDQPPRCH